MRVKPMPKNDSTARKYTDDDFEDYGQSFEPIVGFLNTPRKDDRDPASVFFVGEIVEQVKANDDSGAWLKFKSHIDQPECEVRNKDGEVSQVSAGDLIGVNQSAPLKGLEEKVGYLARLTFTGKKI